MHYTYLEFGRSFMSPGSGPSTYRAFTWDTYSAPTVNDGHGDRLVRVERTLSTLARDTRELRDSTRELRDSTRALNDRADQHEQRIASLESRAESFDVFRHETGSSVRGGRRQQRRAAPEDSEDLSNQTGTLSKAAKQAKLMLQVS